jgi:hypothetical protein
MDKDRKLTNDEVKEIRQIIGKSTKQRGRKKCSTPKCDRFTKPYNHLIAKNVIKCYESEPNTLLKTTKNSFDVMLPPVTGRELIKQLSIKKEPAFKAFCDKCDSKLFNEIDNYRHKNGEEISDRALLQMHYRLICNGIKELEKFRIIAQNLLFYSKQKGWQELSNSHEEHLNLILKNLQIHFKEKRKCENHLFCREIIPKMARIILLGNQSNPLCFGRLGYFAYQFSHSKEDLLSNFFGHMPYVTFSSIIGVNGDSHLVFTALPERQDHLKPVISMLNSKNGEGNLAVLIHYFSDGCLLKENYYKKHNEIILSALNYFIENDGLINVA